MSVNNPKCPEKSVKNSRKFECTLIDANNTFTDRSHERLSTFCHWAVFPGVLLAHQCHYHPGFTLSKFILLLIVNILKSVGEDMADIKTTYQ